MTETVHVWYGSKGRIQVQSLGEDDAADIVYQLCWERDLEDLDTLRVKVPKFITGINHIDGWIDVASPCVAAQLHAGNKLRLLWYEGGQWQADFYIHAIEMPHYREKGNPLNEVSESAARLREALDKLYHREPSVRFYTRFFLRSTGGIDSELWTFTPDVLPDAVVFEENKP